MFFVIQVLQGILGIVSLVCLILVLIKMFQSGETTLGIVCIVLLLCFAIGYFIAFIFGWINAQKWDIKNVMWIWTGSIIAGIVLSVVAFSMGAAMIPLQGP
jgi:hypothetical protein